jgi:hypothetical protein
MAIGQCERERWVQHDPASPAAQGLEFLARSTAACGQ